MWSSFSLEKASELTMCSGYRLTAQISDSDTPVLPPVYSTTEPPGLRRPSASAASIMASAMRSFMLPVGFSFSNFNRMRTPILGVIFRKGSKEVLPMQHRMSRGGSFMTGYWMTNHEQSTRPSRSACDGDRGIRCFLHRHERDSFAITLDLGWTIKPFAACSPPPL